MCFCLFCLDEFNSVHALFYGTQYFVLVSLLEASNGRLYIGNLGIYAFTNVCKIIQQELMFIYFMELLCPIINYVAVPILVRS
jgi:hypothetical protein